MSFRIQPTPVARPNRCQLFGPGSRPAIFEKMAASAADVINLDLEDSVAPSDKDSARQNVIDAIGSIDWGTKTLSVRINGLDTPYWYRDVVELLENASERLDQIMIPKVGCAADLYAVDALVTAAERAQGRTKQIAFEVIIESAAGIAHVEEIAAATPAFRPCRWALLILPPLWVWRRQVSVVRRQIITCTTKVKTIGLIHGIGRNLPSSRRVAHMAFCQ